MCSVIQTAHKLGYYTITCDYLPDNTAHKFSDEYHNVSIIDKEAVLKLAQELKIDGIISFACDPGVVTAAYVAEKMGLPFQGSYESTRILQDKGLFREFLSNNGFNCPHAKSYSDSSSPFHDLEFFHWPVIVKPVDSAGSKGVTKVDSPDKLADAIEYAIQSSLDQRFIIEDYLTFEGYHSTADCFSINGELKFYTYADHLFDSNAPNPFVPICQIYPSMMSLEHQEYLAKETQRLMKLLDMRSGIYNIETCVASDGKAYIMEVSPRGGGNMIADIQKLAFGIDLIEAELKCAVGDFPPPIDQYECDGVWCEMAIHDKNGNTGVFESLYIDPVIEKKHVKHVALSVKQGDFVEPFTGANKALGDMFLRFDSREELNEAMNHIDEWMKIKLK